MQIRDLSGTELPRGLWKAVADAMGLSGLLPQAVRGEFPAYYAGRRLHVTVNKRAVRHARDGQVVCGAYSLGKIYLYPCPRCTYGFLTRVFLHEICHAWLDSFHRDLYFMSEACALCDKFSTDAYTLLGGKCRADVKCWTCRLAHSIN